jgi:Ras-related protein Rab-7A
MKELFASTWFNQNYFRENVKLLGKGGNGSVFSATRRSDKLEVAIKFMKCEDIATFNHLSKEVMSLFALNHENIVKIFDYSLNPLSFMINNSLINEYQVFISMEKADETLEGLLEKNVENPLEMETLMNLIRDLLSGLHFAHCQKIVHSDIKPANVFLFNKKGKLRAKLGDWGSGAMLQSSKTVTQTKTGMGYTPSYASPEVMDEENDGKEMNFYFSDIYSLGMSLLRCLGIPHAKMKKLNQMEEEKHQAKVAFLLDEVKLENKEIKEVIRMMLNFKPKERPTTKDCLKQITMISNFSLKPLLENAKAEKSLNIVLVGESGAGKSAFLLRFVYDHFSSSISTTYAASFVHKKVFLQSKQVLKLIIWDTAGQKNFRALLPIHLKNADCVMVIQDLTQDFENEFRLTKELIETAKDVSPDTEILFVGSKCDQFQKKNKNFDSFKKMALEKGCFDYIETSAKEGINVDEAFQLIIERFTNFNKLKENIEGGEIKLTSKLMEKERKKCGC